MVVFFVDLSAAFDSVDRRVLSERKGNKGGADEESREDIQRDKEQGEGRGGDRKGILDRYRSESGVLRPGWAVPTEPFVV